MGAVQRRPDALPEAREILALLHQLDLVPCALPGTYDIMVLLRQLYAAPVAPGAEPQPVLSQALPTREAVQSAATTWFQDVPWEGKADTTAVVHDPAPANDGQTPESVSLPAPAASPAGPLDVSVRAFLAAVPWDGKQRQPLRKIPAFSKASAPRMVPASLLSRQSVAQESPVGEAGAVYEPAPGAASTLASAAAMPALEATTSPVEPLDISVRAFLAAVPWDGKQRQPRREVAAAPQVSPPRPAPVRVLPQGDMPPAVVTPAMPPNSDMLHLSVKDFVAQVSWDGRRAVRPHNRVAA